MSKTKDNSNVENKLKKNIMPIAITTNNNPNNYVFVNKKNQIAALYLKMGQKMQSKKLKNTKSNSNIQNSYDSSNIHNNFSNNSLQLCNFSMLNNLKTNDNISGFATNRAQNNENTIPNKQDYIIHVNLNHNHISSSNFSLNNKKNEKKKSKIKYSKANKKNIISLNNAELYNSIYCLSTRNKFHPKKESKLDLKKIKNNMKTKKFKFTFNERKKNKFTSASFCNLNENNNKEFNRAIQKSENKMINNLSQNKIISKINNEKKIQHMRYNTMIIDKKEINERLNSNNKYLKERVNNRNIIIKHNNSVVSMNNENRNKLNNTLLNAQNYQDTNYQIKNALSSNGNRIIIDKNLKKEKNENKKFNKKSNNKKNKNNAISAIEIKKSNNPLFERKVKIDRKDLLQEIKNRIINKKKIELKMKPKNLDKDINKKNEKIKEFSKIIVLDEYKYKKTSVNFHNNKCSKPAKISTIENLNKTKREIINKKNIIINNNYKSKETIKIEKLKTMKPKKINNNSVINDSLENKEINNFSNDNNIKDINLIDLSSRFNATSFPFPYINHKKDNYKKPIIKITTNNNISFNRNIFEKAPTNSSINNSEIMPFNQKILLKDKNLIIKKKKKIGNNSFHINKKLICYSSRASIKNNNNNKEIKNKIFDDDNLENLPENYDDKFNDLYAVVHKINFGSVLIGAESLFSLNSHKYKEFQYNFDLGFIKQFNRQNAEENKGKNLKKTNNSSCTKTDFSSSNKNFYKNIYNTSAVPNEFEMTELI